MPSIMKIRSRLATWSIVAVILSRAGTALADDDPPPDEEQVDEVEQASTQGTACRMACVGSYTALCLRVRDICAVGTVVTLGSTVIPCAKAVLVTCLTTSMLAVVCNDRCPP
jgi:hypothetical protein